MSSLLNNTSTTNTSNQSNSAVIGSTTSSPTFSPQLQSLMDNLQGYSTESMNDPTKQLAPIRNAGLDQINQEYASVPNTVSTQLASRGYGSSGLEGSALTSVANAKAGSQSDLEGQLSSDAINQQNFGASLAEQLLNTGKGSSTFTSGQTSTAGTGTSQTTSSGLGGILGSLAQLLMMAPKLGGGGSNGSGSGVSGGGYIGGGAPAGSLSGIIGGPSDETGDQGGTTTAPPTYIIGYGPGGGGNATGGGDSSDDGG